MKVQQYRKDIDGLRAVAVIAVIINHFSIGWLSGGYLGVDIFFVISGFVITGSLQSRSDNLTSFLANFYSRRIRRILPALVVCVAISSILTAIVNPVPRMSLNTGVTSLFGLSNLYLFQTSSDYFTNSTRLNSFTHTWSLGVEEQFYLIYPILAWLLLFGRRTKALKSFLVIIGTLSAFALIAFAVLQPRQPIAVFYLLPFRFWELGLGCLLAQVGSQDKHHKAALATCLALIAMVICLVLPEEMIIPATVSIVAATGTLLYFGGGTLWSDRLLSSPPMRFLGKISYSLYLWHWPILVLSRWTIGIHWWSVPFQFALMLAFAALSYRFIETPWRRPRANEVPLFTIGTGLGLAGILAASLLVVSFPLQGTLFLGRRAPISEVGPQSLSHSYKLAGYGEWSGTNCILQTNEDAQKAIDPLRCTLGLPTARRKILVIGNSFSAAFVRGFSPLVRDHDFAVTLVSSWGASPSPSIPNHGRWSLANKALWTGIYPRLSARLGPGDVLVLLSDLVDLIPDKPTGETAVTRDLLQQDLVRMASELGRKGVRIVVVDSLPFVRDANCTPDAAIKQWYQPFSSPCQFKLRSYHVARRRALSQLLERLERNGVIARIDLFDLFCPGVTCTYDRPGVPMLYRDEFSHPSVEVMPYVGQELVKSFRKEGLLNSSQHLAPLPPT